MNKAFELNYQMKKKNDYFGLKHLELRKPHGEEKKKLFEPWWELNSWPQR